ncbi:MULTISPECIES: endonuclease/exonuclease/phosphatase family protein [unclassified Pseudovibrio]|uniref:endonuclease/exonuclease/phosphatase family protein n=1 Tax=unclassified Pseudovibrio TaxID=2627060 RepID=UPI0007AE4EA9|nr:MULTISPECIES: endonuclease/exonuclease/phosphatase family protein [unclassified Pseudovibrio]KZK95020.1 Endonuclease/Exonuclease/phosphatase family protein [Pseudovibrio sp. W74]KZL08823.1 Endonuclease/Exonuclease/phosphatase family protein [Pseudovibrio sp. Ad14]
MLNRVLLCTAAFALCSSFSASADTLRIGTWNIANLHHEEGVPLRDRAFARDAEDYARLAMVAKELDLDIAALQEIGSPAALLKVFPSDQYHLVVSDRYQQGDENRPESERDIFTAMVFAKDTFPSAPEVSSFSPMSIEHVDISRSGNPTVRPTRAAMVASLEFNGQPLKVMGVHLKSSCHQYPLSPIEDQSADRQQTYHSRFDCRTLNAQLNVLENWIEQQDATGVATVVLGDFNRRMNLTDKQGNASDDFWINLNDGTPNDLELTKGPLGKDELCWPQHAKRYDEHIDFVVYSNKAEAKAQTVTVQKVSMGYEDDPKYQGKNQQRLSDHCPVVAQFDF